MNDRQRRAGAKEPAREAEGSGTDVTRMLQAWSAGDTDALARLMPMVVTELRRMARGRLARERAGHTLQPTAVVNEVYLRLADQKQPKWANRSQFFAFAGKMMRWILVDHARHQKAAKRGGGQTTIRLTDNEVVGDRQTSVVDILALDEALSTLERLEPRQSRIVELRYFAGLTVEESAAILGVSPSLVKKDWRMAKAWLYRELSGA